MNIKEFKLKFIQFKFKALKVLLGLLFITFFITLLDAIKGTVPFYMPFIVLSIAVSLLLIRYIYMVLQILGINPCQKTNAGILVL